jgi:hypothetical protein
MAAFKRQEQQVVLALPNGVPKTARCVESDSFGVKQLELISKIEEDDQILSWLTQLQPEEKHLQVHESRLEGTGDWLFQSSKFRQWRDGAAPGVLWCHGIPGAGKTVLSSKVYDHLKEILPEESAILVFYCDYRDQETQSTLTIIGSLLKQLALVSPTIMDMLQAVYENHSIQQTRPILTELKLLFSAACSIFSNTYLVIDALDESDANYYRKPLLRWLKSINWCRLFLTSRAYSYDLRIAFNSFPQIIVKARKKEVRRYLRKAIADNKNAGLIMNNAFIDEVVETIFKRTHGMFLLPVFQIQAVLEESTIQSMRRAMTELPLTLNERLGEMLLRIKQQPVSHAALALKALEWVLLAKRPFSITELCQGLAVNPKVGCIDEDGYPLAKHLVEHCLGLLVLDETKQTVNLVHVVVREYLLDAATEVFDNFGSSLTQTCLRFLAFDEFKKGPSPSDESFYERRRKFPFLAYAAYYWGDHLHDHPDPKSDVFAEELLQNEPCVLSICQQTKITWFSSENFSQRCRIKRTGHVDIRGCNKYERLGIQVCCCFAFGCCNFI